MELQVRKNDGQTEPFDKGKISGGAVKSGASVEQAEQVAMQVEEWAKGAAQDGVVATSDIRVKVLEVLQGVNPEAATAFEGYKKPEAPAEGE